MSLYVLDTDILSLLQLNDPVVSKQVLQHSADELKSCRRFAATMTLENAGREARCLNSAENRLG